MAKIVLIHGYGVGLSTKKNSLSLDLGFTAFYNKLISKDVALFSWYQEESHSLLSFLNPRFHYQTYIKEKAAAKSPAILNTLKQFLEKEHPSVIVCHSLGAYLFLEYLKQFSEISSIKKVVFVQADIANSTKIPTGTHNIEFINVFCPWDPALISSWILHDYRPAGLTGWHQPGVHNTFVPLFGHWNLHNSSIMQKQFAQFVASL